MSYARFRKLTKGNHPVLPHLICRTCGDPYRDYADGWDGECPSCADRRYLAEHPEDDPTSAPG